MKMTIKLTDQDKENLKRGNQQFPWFKKKISSILDDPTEEAIFALSKEVEGTFQTNLLEINNRIKKNVAH